MDIGGIFLYPGGTFLEIKHAKKGGGKMASLRDRRGEKLSRRILEDARRHEEMKKKAARDNIETLIASLPTVIGGDRTKTFRLPIRSLIEPRLVFGLKEVGAGGMAEGDAAGNEHMEEILNEVWRFSAQELLDLMLEDIEVPNPSEIYEGTKANRNKYRVRGVKRNGALFRLAKRETVKNKIARDRMLTKKGQTPPERYENSDRRFRYLKAIPDADEKAVVFLIMDISGSMHSSKQYIAKAFYFCLVEVLRRHYKDVEVVFICHDTVAAERTEEEFFKAGLAGGTAMSAGLEKALEIYNERYANREQSVYVWHATDGDNCSEDNNKLAGALMALCEITELIGICEIKPSSGLIADIPELRNLQKRFPHFVLTRISDKKEIRLALISFLNQRRGVAR